jgi:hypothetical protein
LPSSASQSGLAHLFVALPDSDALVDELFRRVVSGVAAAPWRHQHFVAAAVTETGVG